MLFFARIVYALLVILIINVMSSGIEHGNWPLVVGCILVGAVTTTLCKKIV